MTELDWTFEGVLQEQESFQKSYESDNNAGRRGRSETKWRQNRLECNQLPHKQFEKPPFVLNS